MTGGSLPRLLAVAGALVGLDSVVAGASLQAMPIQFTEDHPPMRQTIRDRHGHVLGTIERQSLTGRSMARDARGIIVATYDERAAPTRDAHGVLVGRGNLLAAFLVPR